ncbi:hypothetical protein JCGZ_19372 [Jatropha curcas]|uniref:Uncharacterized protein n=1 Tax=Jatropha curcas TaxID=180498 RepID=A0A067JYH7_JATCU|nr:hypothetical protein JCGZ_19372 [Jatropha curcas]
MDSAFWDPSKYRRPVAEQPPPPPSTVAGKSHLAGTLRVLHHFARNFMGNSDWIFVHRVSGPFGRNERRQLLFLFLSWRLRLPSAITGIQRGEMIARKRGVDRYPSIVLEPPKVASIPGTGAATTPSSSVGFPLDLGSLQTN